MKTCPRKSIREVQDLLRVHTWAEKGRLEYLYPVDALPAYMGEAIEFIDNELARKMNDA